MKSYFQRYSLVFSEFFSVIYFPSVRPDLSENKMAALCSVCVAWSTMKDLTTEIPQQVFRVFQWAEQWN